MRPPPTPTLPVRHAHLLEGCPNFDASGSIIGMRRLYYGNAQLVRCGSYIYNIRGSRKFDKILAHARYRCRPC